MNLPITMTPKSSHAHNGFSLVEMAIVLTIVALLMAGLLPALSGQIEQSRRTETRKILDEIQQSLVGYAIIYGKLPCPTTTTNPASANYGLADGSCASPAAEGFLPWKTLGVSETDAWGIPSNTDPEKRGYWRYRVDPVFASGVPFTLTTSYSIVLKVQDTSSQALTNLTDPPIAIIYSTGPDLTRSGENNTFDLVYQSDTPTTNFDDITIWISRPALFSRMVAAGKLP